MHIRFAAVNRGRTLTTLILAAAAPLLGGQTAEAAAPAPAASSHAPVAITAHPTLTGLAAHPAQPSIKVPLAQLAKHLTHTVTVTIKPGATVHADGVTMTAGQAAHPGYVAGTTCMISIYGPYVEGSTYPSDVVVGASVDCTYAVSSISVSAYVFSYNPTTGGYYLLNDNDYVSPPNPVVAVVNTSYPISANGYYFGATNGYVGDPIDENFSAVQNNATYVYPA